MPATKFPEALLYRLTPAQMENNSIANQSLLSRLLLHLPKDLSSETSMGILCITS